MNLSPKVLRFSKKDELRVALPKLREIIFEKKLLLIKIDFELNDDEYALICHSLSTSETKPFVEWDFGHLLNLTNKKNSPNYIFSNEAVPLHWDGAFHEVPAILAFYCVENEVQGGNTFFSNTSKVVKDLNFELFEKLKVSSIRYETQKVAHYGGVLNQSLLIRHPFTDELCIRIGQEVHTKKNPVKRTVCGDDKAIKSLEDKIINSKYLYEHQWSKGELLFADNYSLLHGRHALISNEEGKRLLKRIQIR